MSLGDSGTHSLEGHIDINVYIISYINNHNKAQIGLVIIDPTRTEAEYHWGGGYLAHTAQAVLS